MSLEGRFDPFDPLGAKVRVRRCLPLQGRSHDRTKSGRSPVTVAGEWRGDDGAPSSRRLTIPIRINGTLHASLFAITVSP
jgi:hypothetical protein